MNTLNILDKGSFELLQECTVVPPCPGDLLYLTICTPRTKMAITPLIMTQFPYIKNWHTQENSIYANPAIFSTRHHVEGQEFAIFGSRDQK